MFLADLNTANFTQASFSTDNKDEKKKPGMFGKVKNVVVGRTIPGTLTRVGALGTTAAGLYGLRKGVNGFGRSKYVAGAKLRKAAGNIGTTAIGTTMGVGVGGAGLIAAKNEHDRRNRKWWEIL